MITEETENKTRYIKKTKDGCAIVADFSNFDDTLSRIIVESDDVNSLFNRARAYIERYNEESTEKVSIRLAVGPKNRKTKRFKHNGATVEDFLYIALLRITLLNEKMACKFNTKAMNHITKAIDALDDRKKDRRRRNVLNTTKE